MQTQNYNALNAVARLCNDEMRKVDRSNVKLLAEISTRHAKKIEPLGFSKIDLLCEIGVINGRLTSKRNEH